MNKNTVNLCVILIGINRNNSTRGAGSGRLELEFCHSMYWRYDGSRKITDNTIYSTCATAGGELRRWKCPTTDVVDDTPSSHTAHSTRENGRWSVENRSCVTRLFARDNGRRRRRPS